MSEIHLKLKAINNKLHEEPEIIELFTQGEFHYQNGAAYYIYEETEISGMPGVKTTLKVRPQSASIIRRGDFHSRMDLIKDEKTYTSYNTPYGQIDMEVFTHDILVDIDPQTGYGHIKLSYYLNIMGEELNNTIELTIGKDQGALMENLN